jgi:hypothetical protein
MPEKKPQSLGKVRRTRPRLAALVGLGLFVSLAGAGAWYVASEAAANALDAMIASEETHGRVWSCPQRRISIFPFGMELTCQEPSFHGLVSGRPMQAKLQALRASVSLFHPHDVAGEIGAPFTLRSDDGSTDVSMSWSAMHVVVSGGPEGVSQIVFSGEGFSTQGAMESFGALAAQARRFDGTIGRAAGGQERSYDFRLAAQDVANPWLALLLGAQQPIEFKSHGTVTEVAFDPAERPAESLERWRANGGHIDFGDLGFTQGETQVSAKGTLRVDATHHLQGQLDTVSRNIEPLLRRYGINPSLATAGLLLSSLLGGQTQNAAPAADGALLLPLRFEGGAVIIGPVKTSIRLPALY